MCYIKQDEGTFSCGAYALAYWLWNNEIEESQGQEGDKAFVNKIYKCIMFGNVIDNFTYIKNKDVWKQYSNPIKIMEYIKTKGYYCEFYKGDDDFIKSLCDSLKSEEVISEKNNFKDMLANYHGIEIVGNQNIGYHYLYRPNCEEVIDPADGKIEQYEEWCNKMDYIKTNAGIIILDKKSE